MPACPDCGLVFDTLYHVQQHRRAGVCGAERQSNKNAAAAAAAAPAAAFSSSAPSSPPPAARTAAGLAPLLMYPQGGGIGGREGNGYYTPPLDYLYPAAPLPHYLNGIGGHVPRGYDMTSAVAPPFAAAVNPYLSPSEREVDQMLAFQRTRQAAELAERERQMLEQQVSLVLPARQAELQQSQQQLRSQLTQMKLQLFSNQQQQDQTSGMDFAYMRNEMAAMRGALSAISASAASRQRPAPKQPRMSRHAATATAPPLRRSMTARNGGSRSHRQSHYPSTGQRGSHSAQSPYQRRHRAREDGSNSSSEDDAESDSGSGSSDSDNAAARGSWQSLGDDDDYRDVRSHPPSRRHDRHDRREDASLPHSRRPSRRRSRSPSGQSNHGGGSPSATQQIRDMLQDVQRELRSLKATNAGGQTGAVAPFPTASTLQPGPHQLKLASLDGVDMSIPLDEVDVTVKVYHMLYMDNEYVLEPAAERTFARRPPPIVRHGAKTLLFTVAPIEFMVRMAKEMNVFVLQATYRGRLLCWSTIFAKGAGNFTEGMRDPPLNVAHALQFPDNVVEGSTVSGFIEADATDPLQQAESMLHQSASGKGPQGTGSGSANNNDGTATNPSLSPLTSPGMMLSGPTTTPPSSLQLGSPLLDLPKTGAAGPAGNANQLNLAPSSTPAPTTPDTPAGATTSPSRLPGLPPLGPPPNGLPHLPGMPGYEGPFLPPTDDGKSLILNRGGGPTARFVLPPPSGMSMSDWQGAVAKQVQKVQRPAQRDYHHASSSPTTITTTNTSIATAEKQHSKHDEERKEDGDEEKKANGSDDGSDSSNSNFSDSVKSLDIESQVEVETSPLAAGWRRKQKDGGAAKQPVAHFAEEVAIPVETLSPLNGQTPVVDLEAADTVLEEENPTPASLTAPSSSVASASVPPVKPEAPPSLLMSSFRRPKPTNGAASPAPAAAAARPPPASATSPRLPPKKTSAAAAAPNAVVPPPNTDVHQKPPSRLQILQAASSSQPPESKRNAATLYPVTDAAAAKKAAPAATESKKALPAPAAAAPAKTSPVPPLGNKTNAPSPPSPASTAIPLSGSFTLPPAKMPKKVPKDDLPLVERHRLRPILDGQGNLAVPPNYKVSQSNPPCVNLPQFDAVADPPANPCVLLKLATPADKPPAQPKPPGHGPKNSVVDMYMDRVTGLPLDAVCTRLLVYITDGVDPTTGQPMHPLHHPQVFMRKPDYIAYQVLTSCSIEPQFDGKLSPTVGDRTFAVVVIEFVGAKPNETFVFGHCCVPINKKFFAGNFVCRVKGGDPRRTQERVISSERPVTRIMDEQTRATEKYDQMQLEASVDAQALHNLLPAPPAKRSESMPLAYLIWRLESGDKTAPYFEMPRQVPLAQAELALYEGRKAFKDATPAAKGMTTPKEADDAFLDSTVTLSDALGYVVPFSEERGAFIKIEGIRGVGDDAAMYVVVVFMPKAPPGRQVCYTMMPDWMSDVGAPMYKDAPFIFHGIQYDPNNTVLYMLLKITELDAPAKVPAKAEPLGWSMNKLFLETPNMLRQGRFALPWLTGQLPVNVVKELRSHRIESVFTKHMKSNEMKFMSPPATLLIDQGDTTCIPLLVDETPGRRQPRQLLIPAAVKKTYPTVTCEGMVGCTLRRAHEKCFGGGDPRTILQRINAAVQEYLKHTMPSYQA